MDAGRGPGTGIPVGRAQISCHISLTYLVLNICMASSPAIQSHALLCLTFFLHVLQIGPINWETFGVKVFPLPQPVIY